MPEIVQQQLTGSCAIWFVQGAWWIVAEDETVIEPDGPPAWPAPCPN